MYNVRIRENIMIAHSLPREVFGPAQKMHGATYIVDAEFQCKALDENNIVIDIGKAGEVLRSILLPLAYQNLDELPQFENKLTTTEFLANYIHKQLAKSIAGYFTGYLKITLGESHIAWAGFEGKV